VKPLIEVSNLTFGFSKHPILKSVSFSVSPGDHLSIVGPNGSGKSTLLRCIIRILEPPPKAILIDGKPLSSYRQQALARYLAYVPQTHFKQTTFTVKEYLELARYPHNDGWGKSTPADRIAVARALDSTELSELVHRPMNRLSGGECQKVLIAAALAQEARVLLLDEATAFLDFKHKTEIHELLAALNRKGMTILSVTHDINHAALNSNRIIALKAGEVVFDGPSEAFMTPEVMHLIFSQQFLFASHPSTGSPVVVPKAVS
jgi:iron complex transport system ATP-binding protein